MNINGNDSSLYQPGQARLADLRMAASAGDRERLLTSCDALHSACEDALLDWVEAEAGSIADLDTALSVGPGIGAVTTSMRVLSASIFTIHLLGPSSAGGLVESVAELLDVVGEVMFGGDWPMSDDTLLGLALALDMELDRQSRRKHRRRPALAAHQR